MHGLDVTVVMPHGDGVDGEGLAEIHLHPMRAFPELDCIVIDRFLLPSVMRLNSPKNGATLLVAVMPAATFLTPLGT